MKLKELIERRRSEVEALVKGIEAARARQAGITTVVRQQGREDLTVVETQEYETLRTQIDADEARYRAAKSDLDELERAEAEEDRVEREQTQTAPTAAARIAAGEPAGPAGIPQQRAYDQVHRIGQEARTYRQDEDPKGRQFLRDVASQFLNRSDFDATERLQRHMGEERVERGADYLSQQQARAAGTGAFAGLVVPQYLTDMYAPAVKALRPLADVCNHHDLPATGMTVNISRITTSTTVGLQASENTAVAAQDIDDTLLTVPVQTAAGQATLSRQALERGQGVEEVTVEDLMGSWATTLDSTLINQAVTGLSAVATANTYTDASPTAAEMYPKILQAAAGSEAALLARAYPDIAVSHSRRWYWMQSQLTSTWPMFQQNNLPAQSGGLVNAESKYGAGYRGLLPSGLAMIVDNNVPTNLGAGTNEDELYVVPSKEAHLWEDTNAPMFIRADQPAAASLGVLLVLYSYFAYTFGRYPAGFQKISGTGLITPSFT